MENHDTRDKTPHEPKDTSVVNHSSGERKSFLGEIVHVILVAAFIVLPIRLFIAQPFIVSGSSMIPTFDNGDYLIVDQLSYKLDSPERGEVIVFRYPNDPSKFFIKRIIGLPGERVEISEGVITIYNDESPEGFTIDEPYILDRSTDSTSVTLGEEEYFVLGDNRNASSDSRIWGPLPAGFIVGRAFLRLLPVSGVDVLPGDYSQTLE